MPQLYKHSNVSCNFMSCLFYIAFIVIIAFPVGLKAQQTQTAIIKGRRYTGQLDKSGFCLITQKRDTVLSLPQADFFGFTFKDFNLDGYKDIYLEWSGNMPDRYTLYLFVPSKGNFKELTGFSEVPSAKPVKGTVYYYSYYPSGCADMTWGSDLFYVKDYKIFKLGNIKGDGCGIKDDISIFRVRDEKKLLIKTLPLITIKAYKDNKRGYIKHYWTNNYSKFI
ncbi:XAC2610-related protein [Hymenobacter sp.]|uniref:XAC2610-related protein n=1 Tax=Hymenobacter sp. TaxID=1898978 RepID=UPI002ED7F689